MRSKLGTTKNGAAASDVGTTGPCLRRFATPVDSLSAIGSFGLRIFVECHFGGFRSQLYTAISATRFKFSPLRIIDANQVTGYGEPNFRWSGP